MNTSLVAVIMGSDSDLSIMQPAIDILQEFQIPHRVEIVSAHRTPDYLVEFSKAAYASGYKVIIAGAGGSAHLPGMVASLTPLPVIGVPVLSNPALQGWDALLSIVQMPPGVPVATVAINGSKNAGLLAIQMLSIQDESLVAKMKQYKEALRVMVEQKNASLHSSERGIV